MKKLPIKKRLRDVKFGVENRRYAKSILRREGFGQCYIASSKSVRNSLKGLDVEINQKNQIVLFLPSEMNFSSKYEITVLNLYAIRRFVRTLKSPKGSYKLVSVNFDRLKKISTSAALVLTAELSKWDDEVRQRLCPMIENWDKAILRNFKDLGFFELFKNKKFAKFDKEIAGSTDLKIVRYIKGRCGDSKKARDLKAGFAEIIGDKINKWTFLHSGLTEAITNVGHHAYPNNHGFSENDKNWYLTGGFNEKTKDFKIVFYDQGIGVPRSLPASDVWEKVLKKLYKIPLIDRKKDEVLLRAAVELDRTSTKESDRGKGLQDLLEFIRQRGNGYLSILSSKGLYKFESVNGVERVKTERFMNPVRGTLIIWNANLTDTMLK